jgi:hypothetical protein
MNDTNIFIKPLNNTNTKNNQFIIGDSPTVTFNDNVTVYAYPKVEYTDSYTQTQQTQQTQKNIFKKLISKFYKFRI